jgi:hypothetical protein
MALSIDELLFLRRAGVSEDKIIDYGSGSTTISNNGFGNNNSSSNTRRNHGSLRETMSNAVGSKGNNFATSDIVLAVKEAGSANPRLYAQSYLKEMVGVGRIKKLRHGKYLTLV